MASPLCRCDGVTNRIPLWRCWWLYQSTNAANQERASSVLVNGRRGSSGRYLTVRNRDSEYELPLLPLGLEKDLSTPKSSSSGPHGISIVGMEDQQRPPPAFADPLAQTGTADEINGDLRLFPIGVTYLATSLWLQTSITRQGYSHIPRTLVGR